MPTSTRLSSRYLTPFWFGLVAFGLACSGSHVSGDRAGTVNWTLKIQPTAPSLIPNQTVQFQAIAPWGGDALWSVVPAAAGTITATGLFTASSAIGTYTVLAVWAQDVRYTASTTVSILVAPPAAVTSANLVQASGVHQGTASGTFTNAPVVGEPVQAAQATTASQTIKVRHGFHPPGK